MMPEMLQKIPDKRSYSHTQKVAHTMLLNDLIIISLGIESSDLE